MRRHRTAEWASSAAVADTPAGTMDMETSSTPPFMCDIPPIDHHSFANPRLTLSSPSLSRVLYVQLTHRYPHRSPSPMINHPTFLSSPVISSCILAPPPPSLPAPPLPLSCSPLNAASTSLLPARVPNTFKFHRHPSLLLLRTGGTGQRLTGVPPTAASATAAARCDRRQHGRAGHERTGQRGA